MIYVVSGATSFIGIELIQFLLSEEHTVIAVCRRNSMSLNRLPGGVNIVYADMSEYKDLHRLIENADVFFNLAWGGTTHEERNIKEIQMLNAKYSLDALQSAERIGCKVFVEAGSQAEYGTVLSKISEDTECHPFSEYGKAKLFVKNEAFRMSDNMKMKYLHLRIFSLFGENDKPWTMVQSVIDKMLRNEIVELSDCTQQWNFLYVKDAVQQFVRLVDYAIAHEDFRHEVFNIASEDTRVLKDFVEEMKQVTKSNSVLRYGTIKTGNVVSLNPNVSKTKQAIGFINSYVFCEVINRIVNIKMR